MRLATAAAFVLLMAGCASPPQPVERPADLPTYTAAAARYNARIERLDRVWAAVNLTIRSPKDSGGTSVDHADGHLQIELPRRTWLSVEKLGETYLVFGSDEDRYWWIDLSDPERKIALWGLHSGATPELTAELGLPVHPLELLDLVAVSPLPAEGAGEVSWDEETGEHVVSVAGLWGERRMWLAPVTFAPQRVVLYGRAGEVRADCRLARYDSVPVQGDGRVPPKMASQFRIQMPEAGVSVTLELYRAENKPISERAFDLAGLVEAYGVAEVVELNPAAEARPGR